jgi:hypothetical protein
MMTSLALSIVSSKTGEPTESVLPAEEAPAQQTLPFQPPEPTESGTVPDSSTGGAAEESSPGEPPVDENEPAP